MYQTGDLVDYLLCEKPDRWIPAEVIRIYESSCVVRSLVTGITHEHAFKHIRPTLHEADVAPASVVYNSESR